MRDVPLGPKVGFRENEASVSKDSQSKSELDRSDTASREDPISKTNMGSLTVSHT